MPRIIVSVSCTVGSSIGRSVGAQDRYRDEGGCAQAFPVGWGHVRDTLTEDGQEAEALVLMREPALPRRELPARPVAVLHLQGQNPTDELVCVTEDENFIDLVDLADLPRWHAEPTAWVAALDKMSPEHVHVVTSCGSRAEADHLLEDARQAYLRLTGCLD